MSQSVDDYRKVQAPVVEDLKPSLAIKCDVCGEPAVGHACSSTGPITFAYCTACLAANREPYIALVASAVGMESLDEVADWYRPIILLNLEAEGKTLEEFFTDTKKAMEDYAADQEEDRG